MQRSLNDENDRFGKENPFSTKQAASMPRGSLNRDDEDDDVAVSEPVRNVTVTQPSHIFLSLNDVIVYFKKRASPGRQLWHVAVKFYSLNPFEYPKWNDEICDKVIRRLQENGRTVRFLICRSTSTASGHWCVATYKEVLTRTKQRFNDDRKEARRAKVAQSLALGRQAIQQNVQPVLISESSLERLSRMESNIAFLQDDVCNNESDDASIATFPLDLDENSGGGVLVESNQTSGFILETSQSQPTSTSILASPSSTSLETVFVTNHATVDWYGDAGTYTGWVIKENNIPHGTDGKMMYLKAGRAYEGTWYKGRWHEYGCAWFSNGDSYQGPYHFGLPHGENGKYRWNDGTVYEGGFSEGRRHGQGKCTRPSVGQYVGTFVNGKREGFGTYVAFADGQRYDGSWRDGHFNGAGTLTWNDGRSYSGVWRNGMAVERGSDAAPAEHWHGSP